MPIRLNLLKEHQDAEEARRCDPVKRAILGGVLMVVCVLVWAGVLQLKAIRSNAEFNNIQGNVQSLDKTYKLVLEHKNLISETEDRLLALQRFTTNRFLWGSTLNGLQHLLAGTEGITITRIRGEQTYLQQPEFKPKTPKEGPAKPATATEKVVITMDVKDMSSQPGDQVAKLKSSFSAPVVPGSPPATATNQVALLTISAPLTDKEGTGRPFVTFTLQSIYPDRVRP